MNSKNRILISVGVMAMVLGWMNYLNPSQPSTKWAWFYFIARKFLGENGFSLALVLVGVFVVIFAIISHINDMKDKK